MIRSAAKRAAKATGLYWPYRNRCIARRWEREIRAWRDQGCPPPPPHPIKRDVLLRYVREYDLRTLVETGTYMGDMIEVMRPHVDRIISIELSELLWREASGRFRSDPSVEILQGDSAVVLAHVVPGLDEPVLFWLDAHYSAGDTARGDDDTPVLAELETIFASPIRGHVILIDDARHFGSDPAYPAIPALEAFVSERRPDLRLEVGCGHHPHHARCLRHLMPAARVALRDTAAHQPSVHLSGPR